MLESGSEQEVVLASTRPWAALERTLAALEWERLYALDGSGAVLGVVIRPEEEEERREEEDDEGKEEEGGDVVTEVERLTRIVVRAIAATQEHTRQLMGDTLTAQSALVREALEVARIMREVMTAAMRTRMLARAATDSEGEGDDVLVGLVKGAMAQQFAAGGLDGLMGAVGKPDPE